MNADALARAALRRQRLLATGLLVLVAIVWVATFVVPASGWPLHLLRAGAEAALVGGLADWFAVAALFRHPMGLPIPHTAIVPRRKDELGRGLARFIEDNFLGPDLLGAKLRSLALADRLAAWLQTRAAAKALADRLLALLPWAVDAMRDGEIRGFFRAALYRQLRAGDAAPLLGRALAALTAGGHHEAALEPLLQALRDWLAGQRGTVHHLVDEKSRWWIPKRVDRYIADNLMAGVDERLAELATPGSAARADLAARWAEWLEKLQHDPAWRERLQAMKERLLDDPAVQAWLERAWDHFRDWLAAPSPDLRRQIEDGVTALGRALAADAAMRERLSARLEALVVEELAPHRRLIGAFIAETVAKWDGRAAAERLELAVGRDLQFIRINGTIVGAIVGMALWLLSTQAAPYLATLAG